MALHILEKQYSNVTTFAEESRVVFKGEIDSVDPGVYLVPFFETVLEQMDDEVFIDVRELDFINSSGIKCIVSFILEKKEGSKVKFIIDKSKSWQEKTLEVIQSLDEDTIELIV